VVEAAGIPTLCMTSALDITQSVKAPRAVFVNFPLGHQTGRPNDPRIQRQIVRDAMRAFETIGTPGEIVQLPHVWDPNDRTWESRDYTKGWMPARPSRDSADSAEAQRVARYTK
jgi:D-proline reductase (dithiol) PrdB